MARCASMSPFQESNLAIESGGWAQALAVHFFAKSIEPG